MGVSKNKGTPKWMVKIMETPIKMDDLGGKPPIFGNTHMVCSQLLVVIFENLRLRLTRMVSSRYGFGFLLEHGMC